ncbi:hypothetical protein B0H16DRAFT_1206558, partial [Mycena metata]
SKTVQNRSLNSEAWEKKSNELKLTFLELVKVIDTRWNSHAHCLLRILDRQPVVSHMCNDRNLKSRQYTFSGEEWTIIEQLEEILEYYSFTDDSEIYRIAMILHPRYKMFYF